MFKNGLSGFAWSPITKMWSAESEVWESLIQGCHLYYVYICFSNRSTNMDLYFKTSTTNLSKICNISSITQKKKKKRTYGVCFIWCVRVELEDFGLYLKVKHDACNVCTVCAYMKVQRDSCKFLFCMCLCGDF